MLAQLLVIYLTEVCRQLWLIHLAQNLQVNNHEDIGKCWTLLANSWGCWILFVKLLLAVRFELNLVSLNSDRKMEAQNSCFSFTRFTDTSPGELQAVFFYGLYARFVFVELANSSAFGGSFQFCGSVSAIPNGTVFVCFLNSTYGKFSDNYIIQWK